MRRQQQPGAVHHRQQRRRRPPLPAERCDPVEVPNAIASMPFRISNYHRIDAHETIAASNCLIVVQCLEPLEILTGVETPNKYVIHDMFMRPILYAHESSSHMERQCSNEARDFDMNIVSTRGQLLMSSSRYGGGYSCGSDYLEIYHLGNPIGLMSRSFGDNNFYLQATGCGTQFVILAPSSGSPMCRSHHTLTFPIHIQGGAKVGEIVRMDPGYWDWISDADTFMIHFPSDMPPIFKLLILQATFLIDFTFFENTQQYNGGGYYYY